MSMRNKLAEAMTKGIELERKRVLDILIDLILSAEKGLKRKLMTTGEKHTAEVKLSIARVIFASIQIKVMTGVQPNAEEAPKEGPGFEPNGMGRTQGKDDGERAS